MRIFLAKVTDNIIRQVVWTENRETANTLVQQGWIEALREKK